MTGGVVKPYGERPVEAHGVETWTQSSELTLEAIKAGRPIFDAYGANFTSDTASLDISRAVANNVFDITMHDGPKRFEFEGTLIMVRGEVGILPSHTYKQIKLAVEAGRVPAAAHLHFRCTGNPSYIFKHTWSDILRMPTVICPESDVVGIRFRLNDTAVVRAARDIVDKFLLEAHIPKLHRCRVRLETRRSEPASIDRYYASGSTTIECPPYKVSSLSNEAVTLGRSLEYDICTKRGQCGSLVFLSSDNATAGHKIIGFHVAGDTIRGWCNILTAEFIEDLCQQFPNLIKDAPTPDNVLPITGEQFLEVAKIGDVTSQTDCAFLSQGSFQYIGLSETKFSTNIKSAHRPTCMKNAWGPDGRRPSALIPFTDSEGNVVDPMRNALTGYDSPVMTYDADTLKEVAHVAFTPLAIHTREHPRDILTFEEAVAGCERLGNFGSIARNKSPGFPYNLEGIRDKCYWFGRGQSYDFDNPKARALKALTLCCLEDAKQGIRNFHVYTDFLKDELRTIAKVKAGKTRLISGAPLVYTILWRMYFGSFMSAVQHTRIKNGIAVGVDPHAEWGAVAHWLTRKSLHLLAGDFKQYDASGQPQFHDEIRNFINQWYNDDPVNQLVREVLWLEVSHSRHLGGLGTARGVFYAWNKALPSGHPATSIINSMYNLLLWVHAWFDIVGPISGPRFWDFVTPIVYGDDNVVSVHHDYIHLFNQRTVVPAFAKLGFTYTHESKNDEEVPDTRPLTQISFLKRGFYHHDTLDKWVAPLSLDTVLYIPYWCANASRAEEITKQNLEVCLLELSLHPPDVWKQYSKIIVDAAFERCGFRGKHASRHSWANATQAEATWF